MNQMNPVILLVDDEEEILDFMRYNLEKEGYIVYCARNGKQAIQTARKVFPDIIVLDILMPEMDGLETCRELRSMSQFQQTIIAILTAHGSDHNQFAAFESGADDFISKPIRPRLFVCHVNALLRRKQMGTSTGKRLIFKDLIIDREAFVAIRNHQTIPLSRKELQLLELLASRPGKVFHRTEMMLQVWGHEELAGDRTIDVHIKKLRQKIGEEYIKTIKGVGYLFKG